MNQEIEREIDIKDAFFYLLYHWRSILLAAIVGLIVLAGFKVATFEAAPADAVSDEQEAYEREVKVYNLTKDNYEVQIDSYEKQLKRLQTYMEDSVLMQIDPMQECYASAELYVEIPLEQLKEIPESANTDVTDEVLGAYANFINKGIDLSDLAKDNKVKESMIQELIAANASYEANLIEIEVIAPKKELADTILKEILKQSKAQTGAINRDIREHELKIVNETSGIRTDSALMDNIRNMYTQISTLQASLTSVMTSAESLQEPVEQTFGPVVSVSKKTLLKFGLVGFVLGAFVLVAVYACIYLFSGVIATESELKDVFGCFTLGAFAPKYKKQGILDKWLYQLAGVERRPDDVIANRIAQNITSLAKEGQTILLTGTVSDEMLADTLSILKDKVPNVNLTVSGCFTEDASAIGMIMQADSVIVVESRRVSKFAQVQKLLETIANMDKPLMGYIMY